MNMLAGGLAAAFWGVLLLSILVVVHEGGHYLMARLFGIRVTEFYIGLPSRFKVCHKSRRHGTEFGVTPLLLGGYNRICGMEVTEDELLAPAFAIVQREGRVSAQSVADELGIEVDKAYELLVGLTDIAAIRPYYDPELGEHPAQRDYPAAFETLARDANMLTEYDTGHDFCADGSSEAGSPRPLESPEAQLGEDMSRTYVGAGYLKRVAILLAGPVVNLVLAFILVTGALMATEYRVATGENVIESVTEGSIAEAAGLQAGDAIVRIGDVDTQSWEEVARALDERRGAGEDFSLTYVRDGAEATVTLDMPEGEEVELIGVNAKTRAYHLSFWEAAQDAMHYAGMVGGFALRLIMPQHTMEVLESSTSIVGISIMAADAASAGVLDVIAFMAAVSMSLGFMNLLPVPPLDGGKILIETVQLVLRRKLSLKAQLAISYVGVAFFVFVFVVVLRNDVLRYVMG